MDEDYYLNILNRAKTNEEIYNHLFQNESEEIKNLFNSFKEDETCSCKNKLLEWLTNSSKIDKYRINVIGEVIELEPIPQVYKDMILTSIKEGWVYNGLSIVETFDRDKKKIWMAFFY
jgi:hypothetical protein